MSLISTKEKIGKIDNIYNEYNTLSLDQFILSLGEESQNIQIRTIIQNWKSSEKYKDIFKKIDTDNPLKDIEKQFDCFFNFLNENYPTEIVSQVLSSSNKSNQKFIHFFSFNGSLSKLKFLFEYDQNIYDKDIYGLNLLHLSAFTNKVKIFIYLHKLKNFDIYSRDNLGNTSLHFATQFYGKSVFDYILANLDDVNILNDNGDSPLVVAVLTEDSKKTAALIKKGTDMSKKNNDGITIYDIVNTPDYKQLQPEILKYSNFNGEIIDHSFWKNIYTVLILIILDYAISYTTYYFFAFYVNSNFITLLSVSLFSIILILISLTTSDPGFMESGYLKKPLVELIENPNLKMVDFCFICKLVKDKQMKIKHCYKCGHCIEYFHHHCPWVNKCIGNKNKWIFYGFIFSVIVGCFLNVFIFIVIYVYYSFQIWKKIISLGMAIFNLGGGLTLLHFLISQLLNFR